MDDDDKYPTICGTGTEDYFGASYDWEVDEQYATYTTPYMGMFQVIKSDDSIQGPATFRHVPLAHHGPNPLQAGPAHDHPGPRVAQPKALPPVPGRRRLPRVLVQTLPTVPFPELPDRDALEIV